MRQAKEEGKKKEGMTREEEWVGKEPPMFSITDIKSRNDMIPSTPLQ